MDTGWLQPAATVVFSLMTLAFGFFAGRQGRSNAIATTVDKDWLDTVADDLAEFTELQCDIIWKRWRLKVLEDTAPETSSQSYENEAFRALQDALWKQTFRSDLLKTKLVLLLDNQKDAHRNLIAAIDEYGKHADEHDAAQTSCDREKLTDLRADFDGRLRVNKPDLLDAGRRVLADKRQEIRRSI
jgi:hypothetical protein